jgi:hypothetical protein
VFESANGFWMPVLCRRCNNEVTGSRLGGAYAAFVGQVNAASGIEDRHGRVYVGLRDIYPLRVLKQMFATFLCAQPTDGPPEWSSIREFVLRRDAQLPQHAPFVYLYRNTGPIGRIVPMCGVVGGRHPRPMIICSEVSWPPVGIIFSHEPHPMFSAMENVTAWGQLRFGDRLTTLLRLPSLRVETDHPLGFGSVGEVEQWRKDGQVIWFTTKADYPESPTSTSMTWHRDRGA